MTLNYTYGNDIIVTKSSDTYRGSSGDDIYIISKGLSSNSDITIIDTSGKNIIQLVDDINFIQTKITLSESFSELRYHMTLQLRSDIIQ